MMLIAERNAKILELYAQKLSYADIAKAIGIPLPGGRNVISGVVHRSGAKNRGGRKLPFAELGPKMVGRTFGRLFVVDTARKGAFVKCRCVCGKQTTVKAGHVWTGLTKSCGCLQKQVVSRVTKQRCAEAAQKEVGKTFGYLTVISLAGQSEKGDWYCNCVCKCGKEVRTRLTVLRNDRTKSCGCLRYESRRQSKAPSA